MKLTTSLLAISFALLLPIAATGADNWTDRPIWPGTAPGEKGDIAEEVAITGNDGITRVSNVTKPMVTVYQPEKEKATGCCLVVCPGGGYNILAYEHEGTKVAEYFQNKGVTVVLLKYRVPRRKDLPKHLPALQDAQRTVSLVRANAEELGIDPARIGILGFSAGGHLTLMTSTNAKQRAYEPIDAIDQVSCQPNFAVPVYPAYVLDDNGEIVEEITIDEDTPPMCFVHGDQDKYPALASIAVYTKLKELGKDGELHVYAKSGHGFGMKQTGMASDTWPDRVAAWLKTMGLLNK